MINLTLAEKWGITPDKVDEVDYIWVVRQMERDSIENNFKRVNNAPRRKNQSRRSR